MKRFLTTFLAVLIVVEAFIVLGGYMLFDLARSPYGAGVVWALIISVAAHAFIAQQEAIDELKKQVEELKSKND